MSNFDHAHPPRASVGLTHMLARNVQVRPDHTATIFAGRKRSWREVQERAARVGSVLREAGVKRGDRVAVLALTSDRFFELLVAVPWAGGILVPLNWRWSVGELIDAVEDCQPSVLLVDDQMAEMGTALHEARPDMHMIFMGDGDSALARYEELLAAASPCEDANMGGDDCFQLGYTGGTTGRSKAAMLSHRAVISQAMQVWTEGFFPPNSVFLLNGPMFHAAGTWPSISLICAGATSVIMAQFEPAEALRLLAEEKCTETLLVPAVIQMLIEHPEFVRTDLSQLKTIIYGGSPITEALLDRAIAALPDCRFFQIYGMTELSPVCTVLPDYALHGEYRARGINRAAGRALAGNRVRVVDSDGSELPRGEVGEVAVRGENMMLGYWRRPEETAEALRDGWMHTGDGGRMDDEGWLYIVDRVKDMIISGGENVYSVEVENAVASHPAVRQCAVIGIPSDKWGEAVHAIIRLHDGAEITQQDIIEHCRPLIAGYKLPRSIAVWEGEFPLSPANKVLKRELRAPYWEGRERAI